MNNLVKYDPLLFKCPKGTLAKGNIASFKVKVDETVQPKNVYFILCAKNEFSLLTNHF